MDEVIPEQHWLRLQSPQGKAVLVATILGSGMTFLDGTIVNVATKRIGQDFHASFGALQWVLNGYMLAAGQPHPAGRLVRRSAGAGAGSS